MPCQGPYNSYQGPNYLKEYRATERELCEARWLILKLAGFWPLDDGNEPIPVEFTDLVTKHRLAQLQHRKGDQRQVLDHIAQTIARLDRDETEIRKLGGEPGENIEAHRKRLHAERSKISQLTDDELLAEYWGSEERLTADIVDH